MKFLALLFLTLLLNSSQVLAASFEEVMQELYSIATIHPNNPDLKVLNQMNSPRMIQVIDKTILSLFETETGREICKEFTNGNEIINYLALGISSHSIDKMKSLCSGWSIFDKRLSPERFIIGKVTPYPAKYVFHFSKDGKLPYKGWTSGAKTYIHINMSDVSYFDFVQTLVHEIYQTVDQKSFFVQSGNFAKLYNGQFPCHTFAAIANPFVRLAFSSLRSEQVVDRVFKEARVTNHMPSSQASCSFKLLQTVQHMQHFSSELLQEVEEYESLRPVKCSMRYYDLSLEQTAQILEAEKIQLSSSKSVSLCDYLLQPEFKFFGESLNFKIPKGPRPNIGSGSGSGKLQQQRSYEVFSRDLKLPPLNSRAISPEPMPDYLRSKPDSFILKTQQIPIKEQTPVILGQ